MTSNPRLSRCFKPRAWLSVLDPTSLPRIAYTDRLAAYGVTGSGKFKTVAEIAEREKAGTFRFGMAPTPEERAISAALEKVASELPGCPAPASIAQAWTMSKFPYIFPVAGGTNPEHLKANIEVQRTPHPCASRADWLAA